MNGAPAGFIPLDNNELVHVNSIAAVRQEAEHKLDPAWQEEYKQQLAQYKENSKGISLGDYYPIRPSYSPRYILTGEFKVIITITDAPRVGVKFNCSLIQFCARIEEAQRELFSKET